MKKCSFCVGQIQDDAIKCPHCGHSIVENKQVKWYFRTDCLIIGFLCVGPLALPMLWFNPRFSIKRKIVVSVIVIILTYYLTLATIKSFEVMMGYYKQILQSF